MRPTGSPIKRQNRSCGLKLRNAVLDGRGRLLDELSVDELEARIRGKRQPVSQRLRPGPRCWGRHATVVASWALELIPGIRDMAVVIVAAAL
jgi:hypothetical protein